PGRGVNIRRTRLRGVALR
ncbi:phage minor tail protein L, partial [Escherichia coli CB7326]